MSQGALERALGVSKGAATHWLGSTKIPGTKSAVGLQRLLGIPVEAWLVPEPTPAATEPTPAATVAA